MRKSLLLVGAFLTVAAMAQAKRSCARTSCS